jgi:hypothetical protein
MLEKPVYWFVSLAVLAACGGGSTPAPVTPADAPAGAAEQAGAADGSKSAGGELKNRAMRDKQKEQLPKVPEAAAAVKGSCGCDVAFDVKWGSYPDADNMWRIPEGLDSLVGAAKAVCTDATEKKIFCEHVKAYVVQHGSGGAQLDGTTLTCHTDSNSYCGDGQLQQILEKF